MAFTGAYLTIIYTVLLHFTILGTNSLELYIASDTGSKVVVIFIQGLVFIFYPVIGLLADTKLTRYRMICLSCWTLFIGHVVGIVDCIAGIFGKFGPHDYKAYIFYTSGVFALVLAIVGKGMFESTVMQFGTDQMIEASSDQLSTFIHWYYWSLYIGDTCINFVVFGIVEYFSQCYFDIVNLHNSVPYAFLICLLMLQCTFCFITLLLLYLKKFKNYLNIEPVGVNPVKQIIDVLKYAYHHKYPVRRSALSYYQNTYPSRIDFGKIQYGGPFTNEQVEDTKTVLRLLVFLASLFGFHLSNDGFSTSSHVLHKSCPSSLILLYFISNPSFLTDIVTLFGVPVFHVLLKSSLGKYIPNMIKRIWFGILLLFLQELVSLIINNQISYINCDIYKKYKYTGPFLICYFAIIQFPNNTEWNTTDCVTLCPSSLYTMDSELMWLLVPQILHGFGYLLVFLTVLEFICAQAPFRLKGFIVGIWYAMLSIKYIFVNIIDYAIASHDGKERIWVIYQSTKTGIIGLSLIIFGISCRWYRYRERDEVVNVQGMIEEIFERELLHEEDSSDDEQTEPIASSQTVFRLNNL